MTTLTATNEKAAGSNFAIATQATVLAAKVKRAVDAGFRPNLSDEDMLLIYRSLKLMATCQRTA